MLTDVSQFSVFYIYLQMFQLKIIVSYYGDLGSNLTFKHMVYFPPLLIPTSGFFILINIIFLSYDGLRIYG